MTRPRPISALRRVARHPIGQNAASLLGVQFASFILPLLTLPYLSRVLGEHDFGIVILAQGLAMVLGLLIDFGFEYTGARDVAQSGGDRDRIAELAARILGARIVLIGVASLVALAAVLVIPTLRAEAPIVAFAWLTAVSQGLYPGWFFVGSERLRLISLIQFVARLSGVIAVFLLVNGTAETWIAVAANAVATLVVCVVGTTMLYRKIEFRRPRIRAAPATLRASTAVFSGTGAIAVYSSANVIVLGLFAPTSQVAQFGAAERIVRSMVQLMGPVAIAVFPRIARLQSEGATDRARRLAGIAVSILALGALTAAGTLALLAGWIVPFVFGSDYEDGVAILRILVMILPLIGVTSVLAGGWMMAMRMDGAIVRSALRAGATSVVLSFTLTPLFGPEGLAVSVVAAEVMALLSCVWEIRRHGRPPRPSRSRPARSRTSRRFGSISPRMLRNLIGGSLALVLVAALIAVALGRGDDAPDTGPDLTGHGPLDYDRSVPLRVRDGKPRELGSRAPSIRVRSLSYDGADGARVPGLLAVPKVGSAPFPCVVFQGGFNLSKEDAITYGDAFARLGLATFTIDPRNAGKTRSEHRRTLAQTLKSPRRIADSLQRTTVDLRRGLDILQTRRECLPDRFGAVGISQGGLYSALLAGVDQRVRAAALVVTGGDWTTILSGNSELLPGIAEDPARLAAAVAVLDPFDPVHWVHRIPPRGLMLINGRFDPLTSPQAADALRKAAGPTAEIIRFDGGHDVLESPSTVKVLARLADFLDRRLVADEGD